LSKAHSIAQQLIWINVAIAQFGEQILILSLLPSLLLQLLKSIIRRRMAIALLSKPVEPSSRPTLKYALRSPNTQVNFITLA